MSRTGFEAEPDVRIKAAPKEMMVRRFMLEVLEEYLKQETNRQDTQEVFGVSLPALQCDWENELAAEYD